MQEELAITSFLTAQEQAYLPAEELNPNKAGLFEGFC